jgi:hypothetical protein
MLWSGKTPYKILEAALHDLGMGLGQILVDLTVGASLLPRASTQ